jgi:hypothetical protein
MSPSLGYVLYAIEVDTETDAEGHMLTELMCRYDESGQGSPLTWTEKGDAEQVVKDCGRENGSFDMRVVEFTMSARFSELYMCSDCSEKAWREGKRDADAEVWGTYAEHGGHDT